MIKQKLGSSRIVRVSLTAKSMTKAWWAPTLTKCEGYFANATSPIGGDFTVTLGNNWRELQCQGNERVMEKYLPPNRGHGHLQSRTGLETYLLHVAIKAEEQSASHVGKCKKAAREASHWVRGWKAAAAAKGWEPRGSRSHLELHTRPGDHGTAHNHGQALISSGNSPLHCCLW